MPGTIGNTEALEAQAGTVYPADTGATLTTTEDLPEEVEFGEPYAIRREDSYSANRILRDLRRKKLNLEQRLARTNEALALVESNPRALDHYRIFSEGL